MAFASFDRNRSAGPMVEINMVPLIDVMLVLLVIFIVTAPLLTHAVKLDLPKVSSHANQLKPEKIDLRDCSSLRVAGSARGHATAAAKREVSAVQSDATRQIVDFWTGKSPSPKKKSTRR